MMTFTLEFQSEADLEETVRYLRKKLGVTGEMHIRALDDNRWRLVVHSEKKLREGALDKLKGRRVDQG